MSHTFTITLNTEPSITLSKIRQSITQKSDMFRGDTSSGIFSISGVSGSYQIIDRLATITITKKPFIASMAFVQQKIIEYFTHP